MAMAKWQRQRQRHWQRQLTLTHGNGGSLKLWRGFSTTTSFGPRNLVNGGDHPTIQYKPSIASGPSLRPSSENLKIGYSPVTAWRIWAGTLVVIESTPNSLKRWATLGSSTVQT